MTSTPQSKQNHKVEVKPTIRKKKRRKKQKKSIKKIKLIHIPTTPDSDEDDHLCETPTPTDMMWLQHFEADELCYRYKPSIELGRGRFSIVYEGTTLINRTENTSTVVIKRFRHLFRTQQETKTYALTLLKELKILRLLQNNNNILKIYDIIPPTKKEWNTLIVILEYFPADLSQIFRTNQFFTTFHTQKILYQILSAVQYMHSMNIAHCHLEPSNIRIDAKCTIKIDKFDKACYFDRNDDKLLCKQKHKQQTETPREKAYNKYKTKLKELDISDLNEEAKQKERIKLKKQYKRSLFKKKPKRVKRIVRECVRYTVSPWYMSPETILLQTKPCTLEASDMWSIGAIFAEILQMEKGNRPDPTKRCPMFPGSSFSRHDNIYLEQTRAIFDVIGYPTEQEIESISNENIRKFVYNIPKKKRKNIKRYFPASTKNTLDLMTQLLQFNVDKRIKIEQALNHPYFTQFVKAQIPIAMNKPWPIEPLFENILPPDIQIGKVKKMIVEEMSEYNKDGQGRFLLFAARCEFKMDTIHTVMNGYIIQYIEPLLNNKYVIPIEVLQICYAYML